MTTNALGNILSNSNFTAKELYLLKDSNEYFLRLIEENAISQKIENIESAHIIENKLYTLESIGFSMTELICLSLALYYYEYTTQNPLATELKYKLLNLSLQRLTYIRNEFLT